VFDLQKLTELNIANTLVMQTKFFVQISLILVVLVAFLALSLEVPEDPFEATTRRTNLFAQLPEVQRRMLLDSMRLEKRREADRQRQMRMAKKQIEFHVPPAASQYKWRILLTGDSMGDGLFLAWLRQRKAGEFEIKYVPWYGSTTENWGASDKLSNLIEKYKPSLVVFTLGSNELFVPSIERREVYVKEIVRQMGQAEFVWIGPPNWKDDTGINALIEKHVGKSRFFVSKELQFERRSDGAHPTEKAAAVWADTIARWIDKNPYYSFSFNTAERAL
jgi:hypothetical protein